MVLDFFFDERANERSVASPAKTLLPPDVLWLLWPNRFGVITDCQMFWRRAGDAL